MQRINNMTLQLHFLKYVRHGIKEYFKHVGVKKIVQE